MCDDYLVKKKKALNLWAEDVNRKPTAGNTLCQRALSLRGDCSRGPSEASGHALTTFIAIYGYDCSISRLVIVVHLAVPYL